jgi:hypothetical protein
MKLRDRTGEGSKVLSRLIEHCLDIKDHGKEQINMRMTRNVNEYAMTIIEKRMILLLV